MARQNYKKRSKIVIPEEKTLKDIYSDKKEYIDNITAAVVMGRKKPHPVAEALAQRLKIPGDKAKEVIAMSLSELTSGKILTKNAKKRLFDIRLTTADLMTIQAMTYLSKSKGYNPKEALRTIEKQQDMKKEFGRNITMKDLEEQKKKEEEQRKEEEETIKKRRRMQKKDRRDWWGE